MGCLRELEKVLSFHFESWEKGMFLIKSLVLIRWGTVRIVLILGRTKGCSSMNSGIDRSFPKQSLRSSKEAKGAGPAFGCRDLYDPDPETKIVIGMKSRSPRGSTATLSQELLVLSLNQHLNGTI